MSIKILLVIIVGILSGYYIIPDTMTLNTDLWLDIGLCLLLFFVGIDISKNKNVINDIKKMGFRILLFPLLIGVGSILGGIVGGYIIGLNFNEGGAVGAGFGWYSLSAIILSEHSAKLSALAFISNVTREILAFILIPFISKYIGLTETISIAGATSMDTALPIISKNTNAIITIIAFVSGIILSILVPFCVSIIISLS
ncbi:membrane protein [Vallitalea longa]|uniref:Membrane protein n=1 Tax=Vallitalea longa TaxID=2936439 RepID=A0A9W5YCG0_9FIRM|nr:lysine exporter LysO family protein [Vallitalea longa]GKX30111.1 membrane protein [Vallitalea longa]